MTITALKNTALAVEGVSKTFHARDGDVPALCDLRFSVGDGAFYSIVGPSGCGKSTLLNIIAGLEPEDSGVITVSDTATDAPAGPCSTSEQRLGRVAYMPQKDLLLPWRTVLQNASLGLELTGVTRSEAQERARDLLTRFGLDGFADSYPAALSGGMRQRVAFLRTILSNRGLLLLDEPFGALDALTRRSMQEWLLDIWSELRRTVVLITHDVEEAILLSDRVAVMGPRPGTILLEADVDLSRPRHAEMVMDPAFINLKRSVLTALRSGLEETGHARR